MFKIIDVQTLRRVAETFALPEHREFLGEVVAELEELVKLAADSRISSELIGIRVRNSWR